MATNYNITMKQFNGTDYDTLYPAANLSNSIGQIQSSQIAGGINVGNATGTLPVANGGTGLTSLTSGYYLVGNGTGQVTLQSPSQLQSSLGLDQYAKIQTGSYTGTGTYGSSNPNSLTFNFSIKVFQISPYSSSTLFSSRIGSETIANQIMWVPIFYSDNSLGNSLNTGYYTTNLTYSVTTVNELNGPPGTVTLNSVVFNNNYISYYSNVSQYMQFNGSNNGYNYYGLG